MRPSTRARLARVAALPLLVLSLLLGATTVAQAETAAVAVEQGHEVLATESHGEAPGLEPRGADDEGNEFRPADYEANFLWGAAVGLGVLVLGGVGLLGLLYWLMVQRPAQAAERKG